MSTLSLPNAFIRPVDGEPDVFGFTFDFMPQGKALPDGQGFEDVITEEENGDLRIQGWAAVFEGIDRQGENFAEGAFQRGIKSFVEGHAPLCFHHKMDHGIGKVLDLKEVEGKGLWMDARVDYQPESSPLRYIYNGIKKGTYSALSVGGFFKRAVMNGVQKIVDMDFAEISVTPVSVHPGTNFAVVAGKALEDLKIPETPSVGGPVREADLEQVKWVLDELDRLFRNIEGAVAKRTPATT